MQGSLRSNSTFLGGRRWSTSQASPAVISRPRPRHLSVVAFKESDAIQDWRTKAMVSLAHQYYHNLWSKGDLKQADVILDEQLVYRDNVWGTYGHGSVVGNNALKTLVSDMRSQYPDLWFEVEQIGLQDTTHLFVLWTGHGTNLEAPKGAVPSYHNSVYTGVDIIAFNAERSKITEISQFRQPTAEERNTMHEGTRQDPFEIKLARLHWEPASGKADKQQH